jgi:hypothetical protein
MVMKTLYRSPEFGTLARGDRSNAVMESFLSTVKSELADRFDSCGDAKMALFDYIECSITSGVSIHISRASSRR